MHIHITTCHGMRFPGIQTNLMSRKDSHAACMWWHMAQVEHQGLAAEGPCEGQDLLLLTPTRCANGARGEGGTLQQTRAVDDYHAN